MGRHLLTLPLAIVVTMSLFSFMAWMINTGSHGHHQHTDGLHFDMLMMTKDDSVEHRHRDLPKPPKMPSAPATQMTSMQPAPSAAVQASLTGNISIPSVNVDTSLRGVSVEMPALGKLAQTQQYMPISRVEPNYPLRALRNDIEGYVVLQFDIDTHGSPINISIVKAEPSNIFNREALRAVRRWKYQPYVVDGKAEIVKNQQTKVEFRIAK